MSPRSALLFVLIATTGPAFTTATEPTPPPMGDGATVTLEPAPLRPAARGRRLVFACHENGMAVFSDRPCGEQAERRELALPPVTETGRSATTAPPAAHAATKPAPSRVDDATADDKARVESTCARLRDAVEALDARMRAGYPAREAARLWNRWRDAKARLHDAGC